MKFSTLSLASLASLCLAAPVVKRDSATNILVLQFALTLEHLENAFYKFAISNWNETQFLDANLTAQYFNDLKYITTDEQSHVVTLTSVIKSLGAEPVAACEYNLPQLDVQSFVALAATIENVGSAAYLGAAGLIDDGSILTAAGSILHTESLHTGIQRAAAGLVAAANPYGSALTPNQIFSIASQFIGTCPSTNTALPFKAFPALTAVTGDPTAPGVDFQFSVTDTPPQNPWVAFVNGLTTVSSPGTVNGNTITATIPPGLGGQTYAFLTASNVTGSGNISDSDVLNGPAILQVTPVSPDIDLSIH